MKAGALVETIQERQKRRSRHLIHSKNGRYGIGRHMQRKTKRLRVRDLGDTMANG